jgi:hypothetical protein
MNFDHLRFYYENIITCLQNETIELEKVILLMKHVINKMHKKFQNILLN